VATAQHPVADTASYKTVIAGPAYKRPPGFQRLWGRNHRVEWTTPVRVPVLKLDTVFGGLIPYKSGGGNESKSLRLHTKEGKEYSLRSINKSRTEVIPPQFKGTFLEGIVNDGISMSHPYGAFAVPNMLEHAGIYHAWPKLVYLPHKKPWIHSMRNMQTICICWNRNLKAIGTKPITWAISVHLTVPRKY